MKTKEQIKDRIQLLRMKKDRVRTANDRREIMSEIIALQWVLR